MNTLSLVKVWMWSIVIVTGLTGSAFAQHGHSGGGHHHGGMSGGGHHHHHGGYSGGSSSFRFGYGGYGYPSYGYGYGGYPYGYGSGFGLRIYSTPRYYYSTPGYSYPGTVIINSTPSVPAPTFDNGPIVIIAPATNNKPIQYMLNGQSFTMKPGQSQKFRHDRDWIVEFDRGDGRGSAQYSLKASAYKFKQTNNGWELFEAAKPEPPTDSVPVAPVPMDDIK